MNEIKRTSKLIKKFYKISKLPIKKLHFTIKSMIFFYQRQQKIQKINSEKNLAY